MPAHRVVTTARWRAAAADDSGVTAAEYIGVLGLLAAVLAALLLLAPAMGTVIGHGIRAAICSIAGVGCEETVAQDHEPDSCVRESRQRGVNGSVKVTFVEVGGGAGYLREERSDGEIHVTWIEDGQVGATAGVGARGGITVPSGDWNAGAHASVEGHLGTELGSTRVFTEAGEADAYITRRRNHALREVAETVAPPLRIATGINDLIRGGPDLGEPDLVYFDAKVGGSGDAAANYGPAGAKAEAEGAVTAGAVRDRRTGETTLYVKADGDVGGQAGMILGRSGSQGGEVVLALTLDNDGNPVTLATSRTTTTGQGGLLGAPNLSLDALDAVLSEAAFDAEATHTVAVTSELDLRRPANRQAALDVFYGAAGLGTGVPGSAGDLQAAADRYAARILADGTVGVTEHEGSTWGLGAGAEVALGAKLGLDLGYQASDSRLTDASYLGAGLGGQRLLVPWAACTG